MERMIFLNTGWMKSYDGLSDDDSKIVGGGSYVAENGYGYEIYNFRKINGKVYGYVQPNGQNNLQRLGARPDDESLSDVIIIWTAANPLGGVYIVGWYKNATLFRHYQQAKQMPLRKYKGEYLGYYAVAKAKDARLLGLDERTYVIPTGSKGGKGRSNVWYADDPSMKGFKKKVLNYIQKVESGESLFGEHDSTVPRQSDPLLRQRVEREAIICVTNYYRNLGYKVDSVEKDNVGWDLNITFKKIHLKVEVKGLSCNEVNSELTPNEFAQMKLNKNNYRLAVVTNCLNSPTLTIFSYSPDRLIWESEDGKMLNIQEKVSAKIFL